MRIEFLDDAEEELIEAALWYESKEPGLGKRFRNEIAYVIEQIRQDPFLCQERESGYRRFNCPVFPYYLPYIIRENRIIVVAVAHGHRMPEYWKVRIG